MDGVDWVDLDEYLLLDDSKNEDWRETSKKSRKFWKTLRVRKPGMEDNGEKFSFVDRA